MISISVCWPVADHVKSPGSLNSSTCLSPSPPPPPTTRRTIAIVLARNRDRVSQRRLFDSRNEFSKFRERRKGKGLNYLSVNLTPISWPANYSVSRACMRARGGRCMIYWTLVVSWMGVRASHGASLWKRPTTEDERKIYKRQRLMRKVTRTIIYN